MKYRIKWHARKTDKIGYGTATFSQEQAELIANNLNDADKVGIVHTAEAVPAKDKAE